MQPSDASQEDLRPFIAGLPKAELHMHIEGSLEPEMMFALAERNGMDLSFRSVEETRAAYNFGCLQEFFDLFFQGMAVLCSEQDFYDLTWAYFLRAQSDNVRHAEMFFDPQGHTSRGIDFETVLHGIQRARDDAVRELGITSGLIMCFWLHLSEEEALKTLEQAQPYRAGIVGIGLDAAEKDNPSHKFASVYRQAREQGYRLLAHAGEEGPASYVEEAIDVLGVDRIDHGNATLEAPKLARLIASEGTVLTVCPLSNVKLAVVDEMHHHPLKTMLEHGLAVTVNSDDPAYFGGYINDNYVAVQQALGLTVDELHRIASNSFSGAFLDESTKAAHLQELNAYVARYRKWHR